ncbi:hypothetical protein GCM10027187_46840 [Streptosporangium sandarakinum]
MGDSRGPPESPGRWIMRFNLLGRKRLPAFSPVVSRLADATDKSAGRPDEELPLSPSGSGAPAPP